MNPKHSSASNRPLSEGQIASANSTPARKDFFHSPHFDDPKMSPSDIFSGGYSDPRLSPPIERALRAKELGRILNLHPKTLLRWAREDVIPHFQSGPRTFDFMTEDIRAWLKDGPEFYTRSATRAASTDKEAV